MLKHVAIKRAFAEDSITPEERQDYLLEVPHARSAHAHKSNVRSIACTLIFTNAITPLLKPHKHDVTLRATLNEINFATEKRVETSNRMKNIAKPRFCRGVPPHEEHIKISIPNKLEKVGVTIRERKSHANVCFESLFPLT